MVIGAASRYGGSPPKVKCAESAKTRAAEARLVEQLQEALVDKRRLELELARRDEEATLMRVLVDRLRPLFISRRASPLAGRQLSLRASMLEILEHVELAQEAAQSGDVPDSDGGYPSRCLGSEFRRAMGSDDTEQFLRNKPCISTAEVIVGATLAGVPEEATADALQCSQPPRARDRSASPSRPTRSGVRKEAQGAPTAASRSHASSRETTPRGRRNSSPSSTTPRPTTNGMAHGVNRVPHANRGDITQSVLAAGSSRARPSVGVSRSCTSANSSQRSNAASRSTVGS
eukprot:TRINITY_DN105505_c0_g1_i1.p1 TRINITY_DN105505_c0_g1~~TRINITY_DN105505_c0_g1_i1.p1  ORF type:complete len:289 (-),score=15.08 TRINITY_DN105505_c0_g1_i1:89-955(-)